MLRHLAAFLILSIAPVFAETTTSDAIAREILAPLLDPAKVATLKGDRPANARLYKVLGWLETARRAGGDPAAAIDTAQTVAGYAGTVGAKNDKAAILWSRKKLTACQRFFPMISLSPTSTATFKNSGRQAWPFSLPRLRTS